MQVLPVFHGRYAEMLLDETAKEGKIGKFQSVTDFLNGECGAFKIVGNVGKCVFAYPFVRHLPKAANYRGITSSPSQGRSTRSVPSTAA